ncbi:helix-hairpin-helix domain-containing protein [Rhodococcus sp. IEGM 1379]|uniref:helix-hairpin-helix domain-containing protein n=1 Tax=Rhodococcus sp. IEGM 1379 TaxID=3047086 RepID=UPI0024B68474|nr:helix-hairpin-helix domain-containing protein [Rhodococcus sp. IEGM 1379]MDI9919085.1 helix-hairpin-helix domain-containing protein [Rhodococcus sp. IEGM 1379]
MRISEERERVRDRLAAMSGDFSSARAGFGREDVAEPTVPDWLLESDEDEESDIPAADTRFQSVPERWRDMRWSPRRRGALALVIVALVAAGIGVFTVWWGSPTMQAVPPLPAAVGVPITASGQPSTSESVSPPIESSGVAAPVGVVVSVVGLVRNPGLVTIPDGSRVADALTAAGGVNAGADTLSLNLAQKLSDGDQVVVGVIGDSAPKTSSTAAGTGGAPAASAGGGLINLNTATEAELDTLPGVGPVTASAIAAWRTSNGKFTDVEQLGEVDGIGPARLDKLRPLVSV